MGDLVEYHAERGVADVTGVNNAGSAPTEATNFLLLSYIEHSKSFFIFRF